MYITQALKRNVQLFPNKTSTSYLNRSFTWNESLERISKIAYSIKKLHISELTKSYLKQKVIATADHCYGCTAGSGSSCTGTLT